MKTILAAVLLMSAFSSFAKEDASQSDRQLLCEQLVKQEIISDSDRFGCLIESQVDVEVIDGVRELSAAVKIRLPDADSDGSSHEIPSFCSLKIDSNKVSEAICD